MVSSNEQNGISSGKTLMAGAERGVPPEEKTS
jgi:hypothetical protein